jgi:hypothetical protein
VRFVLIVAERVRAPGAADGDAPQDFESVVGPRQERHLDVRDSIVATPAPIGWLDTGKQWPPAVFTLAHHDRSALNPRVGALGPAVDIRERSLGNGSLLRGDFAHRLGERAEWHVMSSLKRSPRPVQVAKMQSCSSKTAV